MSQLNLHLTISKIVMCLSYVYKFVEKLGDI